MRWASDDLLHLKREEIGEYYGRYRLHVPEAERAMADFLAAAGCGHSSDAQSSLRIDEVLYGRQGTP